MVFNLPDVTPNTEINVNFLNQLIAGIYEALSNVSDVLIQYGTVTINGGDLQDRTSQIYNKNARGAYPTVRFNENYFVSPSTNKPQVVVFTSARVENKLVVATSATDVLSSGFILNFITTHPGYDSTSNISVDWVAIGQKLS